MLMQRGLFMAAEPIGARRAADGTGAVLDVTELAEPRRDHHLASGSEPDGIGLYCRIHG
jgi:hypothetical protein